MSYIKYGNKKCQYNGIVFDSKHERDRYCDLMLLQQAGKIYDLQLQVPFELIPTQYEKSDEIYTKGPKKGQPKPGKVLEKACTYIADFTYYDSDGDYVVEDAKGLKTKEYRIKKKLMLWKYHIRIVEI